MKHKSAESIRREFQEFFVERGHRQVNSGPVFPQDDPTLLFTNAGMNQFKDVFLGTGTRDYTRAVDTQKCIRVSGKHNDLEEVGVDTYHHTFFEMLGNWSFGDYFKEDAIQWAWQLLTEVWGLPKERLWVTVFGGDEGDGLKADVDAERIWLEKTDIDPSRVLRFGKGDNFWEMGETGPCGPCSEIHYDRGTADCDPADGANPAIGVNAGNERFIELWNLVFMEFNRMEDGSLPKLPNQHVDTGMGFERVVAVLQDKPSNYATDVFAPIFRSIEEATGATYGGSAAQDTTGNVTADIAFRVIADHVRAVASAFADGALPSNVGRGYVLRRLIRRASRYGRQELGMEDPFLFRILPAVAETLAVAFPEIGQRIEHIQVLMRAEEESFGKTLGRGLLRFENLAGKIQTAGATTLPGGEAYELYATFGFPQDLVELMARERGMDVDHAGWEEARKSHQDASRAEGSFRQLLSADELEGLSETTTTYHEGDARTCEADAVVFRWVERAVEEGAPALDVLVLESTPFYAESGGQVGDAGTIASEDDSFRFLVRDTQKIGGIVAHIGASEGAIVAGTRVHARVDRARRDSTRKNHTATHLLQRALVEVLGDHITQQGSYVGPDRLRFDVSHPKAIQPEELTRVETLVNTHIFGNASVLTTEEDLEAAKARGVRALFGEKYSDRVRVVDVGGWSTELCGGTHVLAAGDIGPFLIISEGAIQAGVRRIEALTGLAAVEAIQRQKSQLQALARTLKAAPEELLERVGDLQKKIKAARKQAAKSSQADVSSAFEAVRAALGEENGLLCGSLALELDQNGLRDLAGRVKSLGTDLAVVLVGAAEGKVPWIALCQGAALERGLDARKVPDFVRAHVGGGGGGRPDHAQGQGQDAAGRQALASALTANVLAAFGA